MIYLESVEEIFGKKKTVKEYIDLINNEYNLKSIQESITFNLKRYDIQFRPRNIKFYLNIYDGSFNNYYDTILYLEYTLDQITFNELEISNIELGKHHVMYENGMSIKFNTKNLIRCFDKGVSGCKFKISFVFGIEEPEDLILNSLSFLEDKYGFKFDRKYENWAEVDCRMSYEFINKVKL